MRRRGAYNEIAQPQQAIDTNDIDRVKTLMTRNPKLHRAPLGYGKDGPLTRVAECGADVNARATIDEAGVGGHTAIFHAVTQFDDDGLPIAQLLIAHGADLALRVKIPGDYERPGEVVECTPLRYALLFGGTSQTRTATLLREHGGLE